MPYPYEWTTNPSPGAAVINVGNASFVAPFVFNKKEQQTMRFQSVEHIDGNSNATGSIL
jgi:hypothetical protein